MELLFLMLVFFAGYVAGWLGHAKGLLNRLLEDPDSMIKILDEYKKNRTTETQSNSSVREVTVEQEKGLFFLYAKDNGEFLAQGSTLDEALEKTHQRFPNQVFQGVLSEEEAKQMGLSN